MNLKNISLLIIKNWKPTFTKAQKQQNSRKNPSQNQNCLNHEQKKQICFQAISGLHQKT